MNQKTQLIVSLAKNKFSDQLPPKPGAYALLLWLLEDRVIQVGRLGRFEFPAGWYVYLGSAHGPGGLRARLDRHLSGSGRLHWHIDALRRISQSLGAIYQVEESVASPSGRQKRVSIGRKPLECVWSQLLASLPGAAIPVVGFGASDCRSGCPAHLVYFG